uniref:Uncharacterized protein n=1 Tax=Lepeophtheirus salmonis TaxID=72036 RepID=A0A0K2VD12_LEPSM
MFCSLQGVFESEYRSQKGQTLCMGKIEAGSEIPTYILCTHYSHMYIVFHIVGAIKTLLT